MNRQEVNDYIRAHYADATDNELADQLGITPDAVRFQRRQMGLIKTTVRPGNLPVAPPPEPDFRAEITELRRALISTQRQLKKHKDRTDLLAWALMPKRPLRLIITSPSFMAWRLSPLTLIRRAGLTSQKHKRINDM